MAREFQDTFEIVQVSRQPLGPGMRQIPTSTAAAVLPVTLEQAGQDAREGDSLEKVASLEEAFRKFKPKVSVTATIDGADYSVDAEFKDMVSFTPEALQKRQEIKDANGVRTWARNDLADINERISLLVRLKERWSRPQIRKAWQEPDKRAAILEAFAVLKREMEIIAEATKQS